MSRRVAIAGVALSEVGRVDDQTPYALMAQASRRALADAGLRVDQIDGFASTGLGTMAPVDVEHGQQRANLGARVDGHNARRGVGRQRHVAWGGKV